MRIAHGQTHQRPDRRQRSVGPLPGTRSRMQAAQRTARPPALHLIHWPIVVRGAPAPARRQRSVAPVPIAPRFMERGDQSLTEHTRRCRCDAVKPLYRVSPPAQHPLAADATGVAGTLGVFFRAVACHRLPRSIEPSSGAAEAWRWAVPQPERGPAMRVACRQGRRVGAGSRRRNVGRT